MTPSCLAGKFRCMYGRSCTTRCSHAARIATIHQCCLCGRSLKRYCIVLLWYGPAPFKGKVASKLEVHALMLGAFTRDP